MKKATSIVWIFRACLATTVITVSVLTLGPFSGAEKYFALTDKEAHAAAFFVLTAFGLAATPRLRRLDIAVFMLGFGGLIEVLQTWTGRDGEIGDWLADAIGVALAVIPMYFQQIRMLARGEVAASPLRRRSDRRGNADLRGIQIVDKTL